MLTSSNPWSSSGFGSPRVKPRKLGGGTSEVVDRNGEGRLDEVLDPP
jgi:hypothetical protein